MANYLFVTNLLNYRQIYKTEVIILLHLYFLYFQQDQNNKKEVEEKNIFIDRKNRNTNKALEIIQQ